jgi:hypothetical protein
MKDIFMCFSHIPPENSSYTVKNGDDFDTLINDICKYSSSGDLMLCGNFNARTESPRIFSHRVLRDIEHFIDISS